MNKANQKVRSVLPPPFCNAKGRAMAAIIQRWVALRVLPLSPTPLPTGEGPWTR